MKKYFSVIIIFLLLVPILACSSPNSEEITEIDWDNLILNEWIPMPDSLIGEVGSNLEHALNIHLYDVSDEQFEAYVQACIDMGYTIEPEEDETFYTAFISDGYKIRLVYQQDKQFNIFLEAPEEMSQFEWPSTGLGSLLPATESTYGRIYFDNEESFIIHVGNTNIEEMSYYINECKKIGYNIDITEDDDFFNAYNSIGNELQIMYLGYNNIEISLKISENSIIQEDSTSETTENTSETLPETNIENQSILQDSSESQTAAENSDNSDNDTQNNDDIIEDDLVDGMRKEFKEAMDDYENFIDEYISFMQNFDESTTDATILFEYSELMKKYEEFVTSFEKWEDEELNDTELAYYVQVQNRVSEKLLSIQ